MAPQLDSSELEAIIYQLKRFISGELEKSFTRPEHVAPAKEIGRMTAAAGEFGLFGEEAGESSILWGETGAELTSTSLTLLAETNAGLAYLFHRAALSFSVGRRLGIEPKGAKPALLTGGDYGLGRGVVARLLWGETQTEGETAIAAEQYFNPVANGLICPVGDDWNMLVRPCYRPGAGFGYATIERASLKIKAIENSHGLDEVKTWRLNKATNGLGDILSIDSQAAQQVFRESFAQNQLGLLSIALGGLKAAYRLAFDYSRTRRQGGSLIGAHPAVALLIGDIASVIATVEGTLESVRRADGPELRSIISARAASSDPICRAANAAVQVFGGTGYMRDVGAEKILRDANHLRLLDGTPTELRLLIADCYRRETGGPTAPDNELAEHHVVAANHSLSPRSAFARAPLASRLLYQYNPAELWAQDSARLPFLIRRYRRRVRDFASENLAPFALSEDITHHAEPGVISKRVEKVIEAAARAGFFSDMLPYPFGSASLLGAYHSLALWQAVKAEELAAACGGLALLICAHGLGAAPVLLSADLKSIRRWLIPAIKSSSSGKPVLFAFAITEPGGGSDVEEAAGAEIYKPGVKAKKVSGGWRLSGTKCFISDGDLAEKITVFSAIEDEGVSSWTCFLVDKNDEGFSVTRNELKMGQRASAASELQFDDVFLADDRVIGPPGGGWALNRAVLNYSRIPVGALALGMARGSMEAAIEFVREKKLGGRPLISYQEIQLEVAKMIAETNAMRAMLWHNARTFIPRQVYASAAKLHCSDRAVRVCESAMALMSNHGPLHENRAEKGFRDARLTRIYEGTNEINRLAMIEDLREELIGEK